MPGTRLTPLDHTGDVGFELHAASLEALFDAARAALLRELMAAPPTAQVPGARPAGARSFELTLAAPALDRLLLRWLDELLFLVQVRGRVPASARPAVRASGGPNGWELTARLETVPLDVRAQRWRGEVKGVTYHGLELVPDDGGWRARVVLDV